MDLNNKSPFLLWIPEIAIGYEMIINLQILADFQTLKFGELINLDEINLKLWN